MFLKKVNGPVANFREETQVTSAQSWNTGHTQFRTEKEINFRVGRTPVTMKLPKGIELVDGDEATVVGTSSRGGLKGILVRNDSTGIVYGMSTVYVLFWAIAMLVGGIALLGAVVGYAMVPIGLFLLYKAYELMRAHRLMAAGQGAVG